MRFHPLQSGSCVSAATEAVVIAETLTKADAPSNPLNAAPTTTEQVGVINPHPCGPGPTELIVILRPAARSVW